MRSVIGIFSPKEAALYFERVFPFDVSYGALFEAGVYGTPNLNSVPFLDGAFDSEVINSLLPDDSDATKRYARLFVVNIVAIVLLAVDGKNKFIGGLTESNDVIRQFNVVAKQELGFDFKDLHNKISSGESLAAEKAAINSAFENMIKEAGFLGAPHWISQSYIEPAHPGSSTVEETFIATLRNIKVVDPDSVSWQALLEFRKDKKALSALRDLRVFFEDNYRDKSVAYVEDSLQCRVEEQEKLARLWGFETAQRALSVAFTEQSAIAASATGLLATLSGGSIGLTAAVAAAFPLGKSLLEFSKVAIDSAKDRTPTSTRYLTMLRDLSKSTG
jgi:hypothetical protein